MKIHELKAWQEYFSLVVEGKKRFEYRKNDRDFAVGDLIDLRETYREYPDAYTGRNLMTLITCVVDDVAIGIPSSYVVLGIVPVTLTITPIQDTETKEEE